jgi:glycerate 2-kinase
MPNVINPTEDTRQFLTSLFRRAVDAADPMKVLPGHLPPRPAGRMLVIGAGKASARMAEAVEAHYGPCQGLVITRYGYGRFCQSIEIIEAAHPVPDLAGVQATQRIFQYVQGLGPDDLVIALISGGGSSLLCAPVDGITLADKQALNAALLASGAPISQMNLVRKQVSRVKGGKLAAACAPARVLSLIISDVPGDDPGEVASGPTVGDVEANETAGAILDRWNIKVSPAIRRAIERSEGPLRRDDPRLARCETKIVAAPAQSLAAAAEMARSQGCAVRLLGDALEGEARDLAAYQAEIAKKIASEMTADSPPLVLLSGGECTVTRRGSGTGGPNAEFALAAAVALQGHPQIHLIACDTDGVDGSAEIAGAYVGPDTLSRARLRAVSPQKALSDNDAHSFFGQIGGQIITGPTLTNVNDFRAFLILPPIPRDSDRTKE